LRELWEWKLNAGKTSKVLLGLGSNIKPEKYIPEAVQALRESLKVIAVSDFYQTPPVGCEGQADFVNGCVLVETNIPPRILKYDVLRMIETNLGRTRMSDNKFGSRTIDIDILLYGEIVMKERGIEIPDPDLLKRNFLLITAQQIAGEMLYLPDGNPLNTYTLPNDGLTLLPAFCS